VHQSATKYSLTLNPNSFQDACRCEIVDIAGSPDSVNHRLTKGPLHTRCQRFAHETLSPPAPRERIPKIDFGTMDAHFDQSTNAPPSFIQRVHGNANPTARTCSQRRKNSLLASTLRCGFHVMYLATAGSLA